MKRFPGIFLLLTFGVLIALSIVNPQLLERLALIVGAVVFIRTILYFYGLTRGYFLYRKETALDWPQKLIETTKQPRLKPVYNQLTHVILIPFYKEPFDILDATVGAIANSEFDLKKVVVVLAVEDALSSINTAQKLIKKYKARLKILYFIHPQDIPGEVSGAAGANRTWACKKFVEDLKNEGISNRSNYLLTTFDSDLRLHPKFLAALTYKYLTTGDREYRFFAPAVYLYSNNIEAVPFFVRLRSKGTSLGNLSNWGVNPRLSNTFSVYSVPLSTVVANDFWDPSIGIDDTPFFWRYFARTKGKFLGCPIFLPVKSNAVKSSNFLKTAVALYKQQFRWGWGAISIPVFFKELGKQFSVKSLGWALYRLGATYWFSLVGIFLLLVLAPVNFDMLSELILLIGGVGGTFFVVNTIFTFALYPPSRIGVIFQIIPEVLGSYLTTLLFFFLPFTHAQLEMSLKSGIRNKYYVSEK